MHNLERVLDEIAHEVQKPVREVQRNCRRGWRAWQDTGPVRDARAAADRLRRVPDRLSDLATDGGCAMRYLFGYLLKGYAAFQGFGGLIASVVAVTGRGPWDTKTLSVGLLLVATAQLIWWAGSLVHRSADRRRYAQYQHRLLRLAREKEGCLTVLEAATDGRMTVEKAEEILRELAARGHAEVRISDSGLIVYHFLEILRWEEKQWAKPVDEL